MDRNSTESWLEYLESLHPVAIDLSLDRVARVRVRAKLDPEFPIITVGGTNGKGSTCAMLESMLRSAGYKVGCYTSPHLVRYNERVRINGVEVGNLALCHSFAQIDDARDGVGLTYFEFGTLAAMSCFIKEDVDIAVLEVGLGGRLDAVNIFDADCAVLTNVDLDHMDYLGDNREAIGYEKAGIFRSGRPAIYAEMDIPFTVMHHAEEIGANLQVLGRDFSYERTDNTWAFNCRGENIHGLPHPGMKGEYQFRNASAALMALHMLRNRLQVPFGSLVQGIEQAIVPGRFQIKGKRPLIIFDVAHNPHAAHALADNLENLLCKGRTIAVFAMLADKDVSAVIEIMKPMINTWCIANIDHPRGAKAIQLKELLNLNATGSSIECFVNPASAFAYACNIAVENDRIVVFGSFHTVADCLGAQERAVVSG